MRRVLMLFMVPAVLAACEPRETFVLLPGEGVEGAITVSSGGVEKLVEEPWSSVGVDRIGAEPSATIGLSRSAIVEEFSAALGQQPSPPQTRLLYFEPGTATLIGASRDRLADIVLAVRDRAVPDVSVVGHADRAGDRQLNMKLSRERADAVRDILVSMGISSDIIEVVSHGESNPVVPTPDDVPEPRNRRVEVTVR